MAKDLTADSVKRVSADNVADFDPAANYDQAGPGGATITNSGAYVTGDLDGAVARSSTAMPKPLSK